MNAMQKFKSSRMSKALPIVLIVLCAVLWLSILQAPGFGSLDILRLVGSGSIAGTIGAFVYKVVSFLNSWWGFALAVAALAAIGVSWTAIVIRGVLQEMGFREAVFYATML